MLHANMYCHPSRCVSGIRTPGRPTATRGAFFLRDQTRRGLRCVVRSVGKPPSMQPSATELESLEEMSIVVPDMLLMENPNMERPKAATVSPGVLGGILSSPSGLRAYKNAVENAKSYAKIPEEQLNKALANVGALFSEKVEGRVSTDLDPRLAYDTDAMLAQANALAALYSELNVPRSKILFQLPATWQGIQAAKQLESEDINTVVIHNYSMVQGVAAAQAGVSVLQINMGRLQDWYKSHPGIIRDPHGPREDSGFSSSVNPAVRLVTALYKYSKIHHPKTHVMVSGIRTKDDALSVAGCDYMVLGPKVLQALNETPTAQGYNDGLHAQSVGSGVPRVLSPEMSSSDEYEAWEELSQEMFDEKLGMAGKELLEQGIQILESDLERLLPTFQDLTVGTE